MTAPAMPIVEPDETVALRATVRAIGSRYGHDYFVRTARSGGNPTELWTALGDAGLLGVNVPEEYDGGGSGMYELAVVTEELAAVGVP